MDRRSFVGLLGGLGASDLQPRAGITLEAIAAPDLPHTLVIPGITGLEGGIFELRVYESANLRDLQAPIFPRCGIRPILTIEAPGLIYVIPFADLTAREQAWRLFNADAEWRSVARHSGAIAISLYRSAR